MTTAILETERAATPQPTRSTWGFAHVPALDGLRGAAVGAVLLYHAGYMPGGWLGVDLFFVLSGYLITSLLLAEREATGGIVLKSFWIRRLRRLMPALLAVLVGVAIYSWVWARPIDLDGIRADGIATLFYVANWHTILQGTSYWDISLQPSPLQHTWSLAIEEQFYLVWPFAVYAITRAMRSRAAHVVGWLCLGLAALSAILFVGLHHVMHGNISQADNRVYLGTDTRATALLLGAAWAAWRVRATARVPRRVIEGLGVAAGIVLAIAWFNLEGTSRLVYRGGLPLCSGLAVLVVAAACERTSPVLGRTFSFAPLRWLGLISYGLYLWHWPVYMVIDQQRLGHGGKVLLVTRLVVSLAVAVASFYVIERPIRHGRVARGRRGSVMVAGGMAVALALILVSTRGGVSVGSVSSNVGQAKTIVPGAPYVLFAGDSVAQSTVRPIVLDPKAFDVNPINAARIGCSPLVHGHNWKDFLGKTSPLPPVCFDHVRDLVARRKPELAVVIVGARPNDYVKVDGSFQRACEPGFGRYYLRTMASWLGDLGWRGAKVVIATYPKPGKYAIVVSGGEERRACANRLIEKLPARVPGLKVLDMDDVLCPDGKCIEEIRGEPVRSDGLHFDKGPGGAAAAKLVLRRAEQLTGVH